MLLFEMLLFEVRLFLSYDSIIEAVEELYLIASSNCYNG